MQNDIKDKVFKLFESMKPDQIIVIREFAKKDPESFIEYGKKFIDEGNHNYEFTGEYKVFRRMWHKVEALDLKDKKEIREVLDELEKKTKDV